MKKLTLLFFIAGICAIQAFAQNNVGIGTPTPDASAILDLSSTNRGFLAPRMTTAQRTAIAAPAAGLLVYDVTDNCYYYYNGTWNSLCQTSAVCNTATTGYISMFNTPATVCNSVIYQSGTNIGVNTTSPSVSFQINSTDAAGIPSGTTAQQPATAPVGAVRYNTTTGVVEVYTGSCWQNVNTPPVGATYIQWFNAADPNTLYPCTQWVSSDIANGEFIRARGGASNVAAGGALTGTLQNGAVQDHTHSGSVTIDNSATLTTSSDGSHTHGGNTTGVTTYNTGIWIPFDDNLNSDVKNLSMNDNPTTCGVGWDGRHTVGNFMGRMGDACLSHAHGITADGVHMHNVAPHNHTGSVTIGNMLTGSAAAETRPDNVAVVFWRRIN
jgi:hypothetical protein